MANEYEVIEEKQEQPKFPVRALLRVSHQGGKLIVSRHAFGPDYFKDNIAKMQENYCYPNTREVITFREPTTSESISAVAPDFEKIAKPEIFDLHWLQAGPIVRCQDGVYATVHRDGKGAICTDESELRKLRDKAKKVNGIWILENTPELARKGIRDFGFADYETFDRQRYGISCEDFAKGGLARILEHTKGEVAENLRKIASPDNYKLGVSVWGFEDVKEPTARVVELGSGRYGGRVRLYVDGYFWDDDYDGCAPGVLTSASQGASVAKK